METNKFNGTNYNDWLRNLRIVLDFKNQGYVLYKPLPTALPEGSSPEERLTFEKWHEDNRMVRSIILASMTNEIQKQYDRLEDVPSIMLRMEDVYAVPDRKGALEEGVSTTPLHPGAERSRRLSKDEMILRLGDGKAVAAEAVGSLRLVVSNHIRIDLKECYFVPRKMTKKPFVGQNAIANGLLDLVHTDVCGRLSIPARGGFSYFIPFTDDHSRYGYVYLMRYKSEAFGRFKEYRLEVLNQN
ncbi:UNVERIFIED_CONTAM: hypothetical protein Slati_4411600 [Sesamum latifolium]|uniref:Retrotransposon Copia-like N-terminal domain-containing protein n=1 Tax=Sesamum latifolium TaxID=2727402 RepID=A0AAW2SPS1_9LAMI